MISIYLQSKECIPLFAPFKGLPVGVTPQAVIGAIATAMEPVDAGDLPEGVATDADAGAAWFRVWIARADSPSPQAGAVIVTTAVRILYRATSGGQTDTKPDNPNTADWILPT